MPDYLFKPNTSLNTLPGDFARIKPTCKEHLALYCSIILGFTIPYPADCHDSPLDALSSAFFEEYDDIIWHGSRGCGKTLLLSVLTFLNSVHIKRCSTSILGGSLIQSQNVVDYLKEIWTLPLVPKDMLVGDVTGTGFTLRNGSEATALAASQKSVRGKHVPRLLLDEIDEMDPDIYEAALGTSMSKNGIDSQVLRSSTLQHAYGLMADVLDTAEEKEIKIFRICINDVAQTDKVKGFWTPKMIQKMKRSVSDKTWKSEFLLERPVIEGSVFDYETAQRAFNRGIFKKEADPYEYVMEAGIDWGHTCSVLSLFPCSSDDHFLWYRAWEYEYVELNERIADMIQKLIKYNVTHVYLDMLSKDANVTFKRKAERLIPQLRITPVAFTKFKKHGTNVLRYMLENDLMDICEKHIKDALQKYHYKNMELDLVEKKEDHIPDSGIAWAVSKHYLLSGKTKKK